MSSQLIYEALIVAGIAAAGAAVLSLGMHRLNLLLTIMFSGAVGVLFLAVTSVAALVLGKANRSLSVITLGVALLATSIFVARGRSSLRGGLLAILGAALVGALVTLGIGLLVAPVLTFDSWRFLEHGSSVFGDGSTVDLLLERTLGDYPIALTSLEGLTRALGIPYLSSGVAAIGVMGITGGFYMFRQRPVGPSQVLHLFLIIFGIVGVAMSAYITRLQLGYVNSHAITACFYAMGVAAVFAPGDESRSFPMDETLRAALLGASCLGLALGRVEGLALVGLMLSAAIAYRGWSRRSLAIIALVGLAVPVIWYGRLATTLIDAQILSPSKTALLLAATAAPLLVAVVSKPTFPVPWMAPATLLGLGGVVLLVALTNPESTSGSVGNLALNLISTGLWGAVWWVAVPISFIAVGRLREINARGGWLVVTMGFVLVVVVLGGFREFPYAARWGDSGNRMMIHVLPAFFMLIFAGFNREEIVKVDAEMEQAV